MIFIDFDGVIADMHPEWYRIFNRLNGTNFSEADETDWECSHIPEELKPSWYRILNRPDLYDHVEPMPGALETLAWLTEKGVDWRIATSCSSETMLLAKIEWLIRHGIAERARGGWPRRLIPIREKHLLRGRLLLDDGWHNLKGFVGIKLLFDRPHNQGAPWNARIKGWDHFRAVAAGLFNLSE